MTSESHLPRHVAIILDGNGRWARQHRMEIALGHRKGVEALREIVRATSDLGIEVLSLYAFSTENWKRSKLEVDALMRLIVEYFQSEIDELDDRGVRIRILGEAAGLPEEPRTAVMQAQERTKSNFGLQLNIALNYGGRKEILRATLGLMKDFREGQISETEVTEERFADYLYTNGQPDVDLLVRTSGEMRLSNFMLWQCAYAEFHFPKVLWPDYTREHYMEALQIYADRDRRFGGRSI